MINNIFLRRSYMGTRTREAVCCIIGALRRVAVRRGAARARVLPPKNIVIDSSSCCAMYAYIYIYINSGIFPVGPLLHMIIILLLRQ